MRPIKFKPYHIKCKGWPQTHSDFMGIFDGVDWWTDFNDEDNKFEWVNLSKLNKIICYKELAKGSHWRKGLEHTTMYSLGVVIRSVNKYKWMFHCPISRRVDYFKTTILMPICKR